jgi:hypothetical protein
MLGIRLNTYLDSIEPGEVLRILLNLAGFSSPVIQRHETVQKHTAVNPVAIHSK